MIACLGSSVNWAMPSSSSDTSKSTGPWTLLAGRQPSLCNLVVCHPSHHRS
jgi:hypothetical protein